MNQVWETHVPYSGPSRNKPWATTRSHALIAFATSLGANVAEGRYDDGEKLEAGSFFPVVE